MALVRRENKGDFSEKNENEKLNSDSALRSCLNSQLLFT